MMKNKTYPVTESDLIKISKLFGCLEDAVKEMIRNKGREYQDDIAEMYLYEMTSRALCENADGTLEIPGMSALNNNEEDWK
jgi:hypothetical protein